MTVLYTQKVVLKTMWRKLQKIELFGHIISNKQIAINPKRLERLVNMPSQNYQILAEPLIKLTRKDQNWNWTTECEQAVVEIKQVIIKSTFINLPTSNTPFHINVDASNYAAGWE